MDYPKVLPQVLVAAGKKNKIKLKKGAARPKLHHFAKLFSHM